MEKDFLHHVKSKQDIEEAFDKLESWIPKAVAYPAMRALLAHSRETCIQQWIESNLKSHMVLYKIKNLKPC